MAAASSAIFMLLLCNAVLLPAIVLLALGWRGRLVLDDPRCARCRYDLTQPGARPARCPECGADLSVPGSVRFGRRVRRPSLIVAGVALFGAGAMVMLGGALWARFQAAAVPVAVAMPAAPQGSQEALRAKSVEELAAALVADSSQPLIWHELTNRLDANALTADDASLLCRRIVGAAEASTAGGDGRGLDTIVSRGFLEKFTRSGLAADDEICSLAAAVAGRPRLEAPPKVSVGERIDLFWSHRAPSNHFRMVVRVLAVRVDGAPIPLARTDEDGVPMDTDDIPGIGPFDEPGSHAIEVDAEWLVLPRARGAQREVDHLWAAADDPQALREAGAYARRGATLSHAIEVVSAGTPLVEPFIDPSLRADMKAAFGVVKAMVTRPPVGTTLTLELELSVSPPRIDLPMIMRPVIRIGDQELTSRPFSAVATANSRSRSGPTSWRFDLPALDAGVRSLRIRLEPVLDDARLAARYSRAWGEAIEFDEVVVERRDLRP